MIDNIKTENTILNNDVNNGIDIGISCLMGSEELTYICLTTMIKLANNAKRLRFYLGIDMGKSTKRELVRLNKIKELFKENKLEDNLHIEYIITKLDRSSISHAKVINVLYSKFQNEYCIISDNDVIMYMKNWDMIFMKHMLESKSVIFGIPYDTIINKDKYQNFPCATFCMIHRPSVISLNLDFKPLYWTSEKPVLPTKIMDENICKICGITVGSMMKFDTGSELYIKIKGADMKYTVMEQRGKNYYMNNQLVIAHFCKGSKRNKNDEKLLNWTKDLINYLDQSDLLNLNKIYNKKWFS